MKHFEIATAHAADLLAMTTLGEWWEDEDFEAVMSRYDLTEEETGKLEQLLQSLKDTVNTVSIRYADIAANEAIETADEHTANGIWHDAWHDAYEKATAVLTAKGGEVLGLMKKFPRIRNAEYDEVVPEERLTAIKNLIK